VRIITPFPPYTFAMYAEEHGFISWVGFITNQKELSSWHKAQLNLYVREIIRTRYKHYNLIFGFCPKSGLKIGIDIQKFRYRIGLRPQKNIIGICLINFPEEGGGANLI